MKIKKNKSNFLSLWKIKEKESKLVCVGLTIQTKFTNTDGNTCTYIYVCVNNVCVFFNVNNKQLYFTVFTKKFMALLIKGVGKEFQVIFQLKYIENFTCLLNTFIGLNLHSVEGKDFYPIGYRLRGPCGIPRSENWSLKL